MFDQNQARVAILKNVKSNTQIRYLHQGNCMLASITGPYQHKNNINCSLEVQVKSTSDKSLEWELRQLFEQVVILKEYPQQQIKITCIIQVQATKNPLHTLVNAVSLALVLQGVAMKQTIYATVQEDKFIVLNALTNQIVYFSTESAQTIQQIQQSIQDSTAETLAYTNWLRSFLICYQ